MIIKYILNKHYLFVGEKFKFLKMTDPNYKVISEDIFRECNTVGIQINLAKPE